MPSPINNGGRDDHTCVILMTQTKINSKAKEGGIFFFYILRHYGHNLTKILPIWLKAIIIYSHIFLTFSLNQYQVELV